MRSWVTLTLALTLNLTLTVTCELCTRLESSACHGSLPSSKGVNEPTILSAEAMRTRLRFMCDEGRFEVEHSSKASGWMMAGQK